MVSVFAPHNIISSTFLSRTALSLDRMFLSKIGKSLIRSANASSEFVTRMFFPGAFMTPQLGYGLDVGGSDSLRNDWWGRDEHETNNSNHGEISFDSIFGGILNMAVPKSKISYSKKRIKYQRYMAKQLNWIRCDRCGEPKLPHRICEEHKDFCALDDEDYSAYKINKQKEAEEDV